MRTHLHHELKLHFHKQIYLPQHLVSQVSVAESRTCIKIILYANLQHRLPSAWQAPVMTILFVLTGQSSRTPLSHTTTLTTLHLPPFVPLSVCLLWTHKVKTAQFSYVLFLIQILQSSFNIHTIFRKKKTSEDYQFPTRPNTNTHTPCNQQPSSSSR